MIVRMYASFRLVKAELWLIERVAEPAERRAHENWAVGVLELGPVDKHPGWHALEAGDGEVDVGEHLGIVNGDAIGTPPGRDHGNVPALDGARTTDLQS